MPRPIGSSAANTAARRRSTSVSIRGIWSAGDRLRALALSLSVAALAAADVAAQQVTCEKDVQVRELTYWGRTGSWIPETDLGTRSGLPEPGPTEDDPVTLIEVSRFHPDCPATEEQTEAAATFVRRAFRTADREGWFDFERALRDGFEPERAHHAATETHFINVRNTLDDRLLDPERPEYLMFYDVPGQGRTLVGMMFFVRTPAERGPQFGGPLTVWHHHQYVEPSCLHELRISPANVAADGTATCARGEVVFKSPEMLHVWFVDHPLGPYATSMILPPDVLRSGIRDDLLRLRR